MSITFTRPRGISELLDGKARPWTLLPDGARIFVRLTPKSSRNAFDGLTMQSDGRTLLSVRVRALPEDGRANAALIEVLAKALGLPRSALTLEAGGKSRVKTVRVAGDSQRIANALSSMTG